MLTIVLGLGNAAEQTLAAAVVVERGEKLEVTTVAAEQDFAQIDEATDGLFQGCEFAGGVPTAMFRLAVVLEQGHVVGGGFEPWDAVELVIELDRTGAKAVLDTGAFDASGEARAVRLPLVG